MKKNTIIGLCSAVAALGLASTANATISDSIRYSVDGSAWTQVDDNTAQDQNPLAGTVTVSFSGVTVTINTASGSNLGPDGSPIIDMGVLGTIGAGHTITVEYSVSGFTPVPTGSFVTSIAPGGSGTYTEVETTRVGTGLFGSTTVFDPISATGGQHPAQSASGSHVVPTSTTDPYSITISDVITGTGRGVNVVSTDDTLTTVPDGGSTMMLLGSAMSALGLMKFRGFRKAAKA